MREACPVAMLYCLVASHGASDRGKSVAAVPVPGGQQTANFDG